MSFAQNNFKLHIKQMKVKNNSSNWINLIVKLIFIKNSNQFRKLINYRLIKFNKYSKKLMINFNKLVLIYKRILISNHLLKQILKMPLNKIKYLKNQR